MTTTSLLRRVNTRFREYSAGIIAIGSDDSLAAERMLTAHAATLDMESTTEAMDVEEGLRDLLARTRRLTSDSKDPGSQGAQPAQQRLVAVLRFGLGDRVAGSWLLRGGRENGPGAEKLLETFLGRSASAAILRTLESSPSRGV